MENKELLEMFVETLVEELTDEYNNRNMDENDAEYEKDHLNIFLDRRIRDIARQLVVATNNSSMLERLDELETHTHKLYIYEEECYNPEIHYTEPPTKMD